MRFIYSRTFAIFFGTLIVCAILTFLYHRGWLSDVQRIVLQLPRPVSYVANKICEPVRNFFVTVYRLRDIAKENVELRNQVWQLQNKLVLFDAYTLENSQLKKEMQFVETSNLQLHPCNIIGRSSTGLVETIAINCGTEVGADVGRAVISQGFLVGKIIYSKAGFSTVQLITNANFSIDAKLSQSGRLAIVRGSYNSGLLLEQVAQDEFLEKGMLVVTAGVNDKIPKNLLIGEVGEAISSQNDLFKKATIKSPLDLSNLDFVFLVK